MKLIQTYCSLNDDFGTCDNAYYEAQVFPVGAVERSEVMHYELLDAKDIEDAMTIFERHVENGTFAKALEEFYGTSINECELTVSIYKLAPMTDYFFKAEL